MRDRPRDDEPPDQPSEEGLPGRRADQPERHAGDDRPWEADRPEQRAGGPGRPEMPGKDFQPDWRKLTPIQREYVRAHVDEPPEFESGVPDVIDWETGEHVDKRPPHVDDTQDEAADDVADDVHDDAAADAIAETNERIDRVLDEINPNFEHSESAYSENCTGVVQAYELSRRGEDVSAGPLEKPLRTDSGGPGGRPLSVIEQAWGRSFTPATKPEIESAFEEPGSRGVVYIRWNGGLGAHVFNVENVGGKVRFVDGQPTPSRPDASHYFGLGGNTKYLRTDDLPTPPSEATDSYLERRESSSDEECA